jgi:hypothetical protein
MRPQPLIAVSNVEASSLWYQRLLRCESAHGGPEYERLVANGALVLQLHASMSNITMAALAILTTNRTATVYCCGSRLTLRCCDDPRRRNARRGCYAETPQPAFRRRWPEPLGMLAA